MWKARKCGLPGAEPFKAVAIPGPAPPCSSARRSSAIFVSTSPRPPHPLALRLRRPVSWEVDILTSQPQPRISACYWWEWSRQQFIGDC